MDTIKACGLQQHVHEPTHVLGHTLDVVISRDTSHIVSDITVTDPGLCDHLGKLTRDHFAVGVCSLYILSDVKCPTCVMAAIQVVI